MRIDRHSHTDRAVERWCMMGGRTVSALCEKSAIFHHR